MATDHRDLSSISAKETLREAQAFSLVLGGPLFQLLRHAHLSDDALLLVRQRIAAISLLAWLPLLSISALEGHLMGGSLALPFLLDVEAHVRFLVALPLLILSELVVHKRIRPIALAFLERDLIREPAMPGFAEAIRKAYRMRNSVRAELGLLVAVYFAGAYVLSHRYVALPASTWYAVSSGADSQLTVAGVWYGYVSLPIFQFLLVRWYFRLFIWARFLWQVSRLRPVLVATHPDRVGGLGFLSNAVYAFTLLLVAHGALGAGQFASRILFAGATLPDFKVQIAVMVVFLLGLVFGPLLVFAPQLAQAKRIGLMEYGALAERYVRGFEVKWQGGGAAADDQLVGSSDIQSLADLSNGYDVIRSMRIVPITRDTLLQLAAATLAPIAPLALTMMPLEELLKQLLGLLF
ncbi:hypothetical protein OOT46_03510 [Aquabacterium sp. A7-Y]|uniref:hypothetical protein n=1 Tax=Aquabacterium sp. A7-Y TaxID=1349605 RepID=UPI00223D50AF|nr:hypothetical protein [Aquabacterium sp. A7-Y]MCW7536919.1 hypothetical protein [Aquabacterium sp. A7-Y]